LNVEQEGDEEGQAKFEGRMSKERHHAGHYTKQRGTAGVSATLQRIGGCFANEVRVKSKTGWRQGAGRSGGDWGRDLVVVEGEVDGSCC
jgi:hypothetical protein